MKRRIENDLIGAVAVPSEAPYGGQTQRALTLYGAAGQQTLADYPDYLGAALRLKRVAAKINDQIGAIPADQSSAIQTSVTGAPPNVVPSQFVVRRRRNCNQHESE